VIYFDNHLLILILLVTLSCMVSGNSIISSDDDGKVGFVVFMLIR